MSDEQQQLQVDPNHVVNSLLQQNAELARKLALAEATANTIRDYAIQLQQELEKVKEESGKPKPAKKKEDKPLPSSSEG